MAEEGDGWGSDPLVGSSIPGFPEHSLPHEGFPSPGSFTTIHILGHMSHGGAGGSTTLNDPANDSRRNQPHGGSSLSGQLNNNKLPYKLNTLDL